MEELWQRYTPASRRLVEALYDGTEPQAQDLHTVTDTLHSYLRTLGLDHEAREDIISETLLRLISGVRRGIVDRDGNLAGYIRTIALNRVREASRYSTRRPEVLTDTLPEPVSDDELARRLDAAESAAHVQAAMSLAADDEEYELVRFIHDWLIVADRLGTAPSLRQVEDELGVSHMHVSRELKRFEPYLARCTGRGTAG